MFGLLLAIAMIAAATATGNDVTATRLDGSTAVGALQSWDERNVIIATSDGEQRIAADELLSLQKSLEPAENEVSAGTQSPRVELIDGSVLPIGALITSGSTATLSLAGAAPSDDQKLVLSKKQLLAVQLQPLDSTTAAQWKEIRDLDLASDILVLLKRDGKSLDHVEGVLGDVSAKKIEFDLEGDPVRIDRHKVAGVIYYRGGHHDDSDPHCVIEGRSGLRVNVSQARLTNGIVEMRTVGGNDLRWPLEDIRVADFSAGKLLYLSDVDALSQRWTPLIGLPPAATLAAEFGEPRRNQSAHGRSLMLFMGDSLPGITPGHARTFNKGLALRSRTELVYRLPAGFSRFTAIAGIDPATSASGNVRLEIGGDDEPLLNVQISGNEPARAIDLDITDVKRLRIVVDYGSNFDTGDWLNLCEAKVIK